MSMLRSYDAPQELATSKPAGLQLAAGYFVSFQVTFGISLLPRRSNAPNPPSRRSAPNPHKRQHSSLAHACCRPPSSRGRPRPWQGEKFCGIITALERGTWVLGCSAGQLGRCGGIGTRSIFMVDVRSPESGVQWALQSSSAGLFG